MPLVEDSADDRAPVRRRRPRTGRVDAVEPQRQQLLGELFAEVGILVRRFTSGHVARLDRVLDLVLLGGEALDGLESLIAVVGELADADVDAADRGLGLLALDRLGVA